MQDEKVVVEKAGINGVREQQFPILEFITL